MWWIDPHDPPEVERVTDVEALRMTSAAAQPGPTDETIDQTTEPPEPVGRVIAVASTDTTDRIKDTSRIGRDVGLALIGERGAAGPVRIAGHRARVGPRGFDVRGGGVA